MKIQANALQKTLRVLRLLILVGLLVHFSSGCLMLHRKGRDISLNNARQLSLRGADALDRCRYQDAESLFSEAIQQCETDERAQWGYAQTLWERGKYDEAISHMQQAVQLSSSNPEYLVRLGEMYLIQGNIDGARAQSQAALQQDHRNAQAWSLLGNIARASKEWEAALDAYQRALLIQPDYPEVQLATAEIYRILKRPQRSLATLDRMLDLHPTENGSAEAMIVRGLALADLGQREEALAVLNRAAERLESEVPERYLQVATAQYKLGELVQSRMTLGKTLQKFPENADARRLQSNLDLSFQHLASPWTPGEGTILR